MNRITVFLEENERTNDIRKFFTVLHRKIKETITIPEGYETYIYKTKEKGCYITVEYELIKKED